MCKLSFDQWKYFSRDIRVWYSVASSSLSRDSPPEIFVNTEGYTVDCAFLNVSYE